MFELSGYSVDFTLRKEILIYQLRCGQQLPFDFVFPLVLYILRGLGNSAELQVCYALLELLDYVFELCHLL
jgi:hypothetical protein